jgi:hypothetical protein
MNLLQQISWAQAQITWHLAFVGVVSGYDFAPFSLPLLVCFIIIEKQSLSSLAICVSILQFKSTWF